MNISSTRSQFVADTTPTSNPLTNREIILLVMFVLTAFSFIILCISYLIMKLIKKDDSGSDMHMNSVNKSSVASTSFYTHNQSEACLPPPQRKVKNMSKTENANQRTTVSNESYNISEKIVSYYNKTGQGISKYAAVSTKITTTPSNHMRNSSEDESIKF